VYDGPWQTSKRPGQDSPSIAQDLGLFFFSFFFYYSYVHTRLGSWSGTLDSAVCTHSSPHMEVYLSQTWWSHELWHAVIPVESIQEPGELLCSGWVGMRGCWQNAWDQELSSVYLSYSCLIKKKKVPLFSAIMKQLKEFQQMLASYCQQSNTNSD
jgi:hypothetical protein